MTSTLQSAERSPARISDEAVEVAATYLPHSMDCEWQPEGDCSCWNPRKATMRAALESAMPGLLAEVTKLVAALTDPDDCHFDHHGGCQAHGYLDLKIGEMCPQLEAKAWVYNHKAAE